MVIVFISSYINIFKSYVVYWVILEIIDLCRAYRKNNKINIIKFLTNDVVVDFILSIIIYSVIYFFKISLAQFIFAFVIGVLVICMILTKFTEKDILLHGLILIAVILVIIYME